MKSHVLIDCCGGDSALQMALSASEEISLLGITTTGTFNQEEGARQGIYPGCPRALFPPPGEKQPTLPFHANALHGVDFLIQTLLRASQKITLIALGPLTNIALAFIREPRIRPHIKEIVISGGAVEEGDVTPAAERNFYQDPHAAAIVFSAKVPLTLLTRELVLEPALRAACAIAYLLDPSLFHRPRQVFVSVDCGEGLLRGRSCIDWWGKLGVSPQTTVFESLDLPKIQALMHQKTGVK